MFFGRALMIRFFFSFSRLWLFFYFDLFLLAVFIVIVVLIQICSHKFTPINRDVICQFAHSALSLIPWSQFECGLGAFLIANNRLPQTIYFYWCLSLIFVFCFNSTFWITNRKNWAFKESLSSAHIGQMRDRQKVDKKSH